MKLMSANLWDLINIYFGKVTTTKWDWIILYILFKIPKQTWFNSRKKCEQIKQTTNLLQKGQILKTDIELCLKMWRQIICCF